MVEQHIESGAGVTVAGIRVPRDAGAARSASSRPTTAGTIDAFLEKPADPPGLPDDPDDVVRLDGQLRLHHRRAARRACSRTRTTRAPCTTWAATSSRCSSPTARPQVYDFADNDVPGATERDRGYWRDVGTLDAYYDAHMDLVSVHAGRSTSTTGSGRSSPTRRRCRRRSSCTTSPAGSATRSSRWSARRASSPVARCGDRCCRPGVQVHSRARGGRRGAHARRRHRPRRGAAPGHPRQERRRPAGVRDRRRPEEDRRAGFHVSDRAASSSSAKASRSRGSTAGALAQRASVGAGTRGGATGVRDLAPARRGRRRGSRRRGDVGEPSAAPRAGLEVRRRAGSAWPTSSVSGWPTPTLGAPETLSWRRSRRRRRLW